jgi:hypothetical protein
MHDTGQQKVPNGNAEAFFEEEKDKDWGKKIGGQIFRTTI